MNSSQSRGRHLPGIRLPGQVVRACARFLANNDGVRGSLAKLIRVGRRGGIQELSRSIRAYIRNPRPARPSAQSVVIPTQLSVVDARNALHCCSRQPLISVVIVTDQADTRFLEKSIRSVVTQYYGNWELLVVEGEKGRPLVRRLMQRWQSIDARIHAHALPSRTDSPDIMNHAIAHCQGRLIGFLEAGDELSVDALTWVIRYHNEVPTARWFYSDEDQIDAKSHRHSPLHKPDFSPEYLLAMMFTGSFSVYDAEVLRQTGGLRAGLGHAQHHDLALRFSELVSSKDVIHIPRVLYHRRSPTRRWWAALWKQPPVATGCEVVREALHRRGVRGAVKEHPLPSPRYELILEPQRNPKVMILLPTKNAYRLVRKCIDGLRQCTRYPNYEIMVINNQSTEAELLDYLAAESSRPGFHVFNYDHPFNHSDMHNKAIETTDAELVLFMNNDVVLSTDRWLEQMVATIELHENVAGVGALLHYPDGRVQHAGIILGLHGLVGHAHRFLPRGEVGYANRCVCLQELSGATAALLLMKRSAFVAVGGFQAERYPTSFNEVDLWLRLRQAGYRCLYNPSVQAVHFESATRAIMPVSERTYHERLFEDWGEFLMYDPFYNPNLALDNEQFKGFRPFPTDAPLLLPSVDAPHRAWRPQRAA